MDNDEFSLPPDSALAREMYAHFGLAVYLAQVFEKGLIALLTMLIYHENKGRWSKARYIAEIDRLETQPIGPLLKRVRNTVKFEKELSDRIEAAHTKRNFLIHNYFWENSAKSMHEKGQREIIKEMEKYQECFRDGDHVLTGVAEPLMESAGITQAVINKYMEEMLATETGRN